MFNTVFSLHVTFKHESIYTCLTRKKKFLIFLLSVYILALTHDTCIKLYGAISWLIFTMPQIKITHNKQFLK